MSSDKESKYYGYSGKVLKVNLTEQTTNIESVDLQLGQKFIGGAGYACRQMIETLRKDTDPLGPENILMIMVGPFCATRIPSSSRFSVCAKSPYTKLWGEANCGGFFGAELRKAGYDGIKITGKADFPLLLKIINDEVELVDADNFWGKGIKYTQIKLKENIPKASVLSIGPAGENLVKFASINADGRSAGRTGMGAVLGSKKLKAIVVNGDKFSPKIFDKENFKATVRKTLRYILNCNTTKVLREFGTTAGVLTAYGNGDLPIKYWTKGEWEDVNKISGAIFKENYFKRKKSCYGCPIGCGKLVKLENHKINFPEYEGPEYETIAGFGSMILNSDPESIAVANNLCNDYGIDTISTSSVIALLYNLYNDGLVKKTDIDGLELEWGKEEEMLKLIKKIAYKEGIGKIAAEGSNAIGEKFGISKEKIATVNKLEIPYHDIRSCYGMALTYAFSPRGACHTTADIFKAGRPRNEIDYRSIGVEKLSMFSNSKKMAKSTANLQNHRALYSSLIACFFINPPPDYMTQLINYLIGFEFDLKELRLTGERIFNLKRLFNIKMGLTAENDVLPQIVLSPTKEGIIKGKAPDFNKLKKHYYKVRDWDSESGKPTQRKLKELGLFDFDL
ncbi:MAG: aldehyde ferredoxin oxidoreductase [Candidatus Lokiarchaeota archaeon]|nr:aldehyde ferredoxin oxidoreductase [Candidatus Lokiarchaeota archaeon]MBD3339499.1 aldehyde ferredoxin oxidoreductase [Candidatus Lokiarchaeota archaeon]